MRVGFGFSSVTFRPSRVFDSRIFSRPSVDTHEQSTGSCPHFTKHLKCCDKLLVLTMSLYAFISLLYKQLLQYGWRRGGWRRGSVVRMSVCSRQTFPDLRLIHG